MYESQELDLAYLPLALSVVSISSWRSHKLLNIDLNSTPRIVPSEQLLPLPLETEKTLEIPGRSSSHRPGTASSEASRQGFTLLPGRALIHQLSKASLRSVRSQKMDGSSLRRKMFGSISSRAPTTTKLNDTSSTNHDSSNEDNPIREPPELQVNLPRSAHIQENIIEPSSCQHFELKTLPLVRQVCKV